MTGAVTALLADGRLHLQHGPIDLIIAADGESTEVRAAYVQARERFATILAELVAELPRLRMAVGDVYPLFAGPTARRMAEVTWPHRDRFVTPMAAVAGAVADEVLAAMTAGRTLDRAHINNGGDIALYLASGAAYRTGIVANPDTPAIDGLTDLRAEDGVGGIATSGWRGRSHSLGIADSVTVLAATAAKADVAATLIANAVNAEHPAIERAPADSLDADTDLGALPVTVAVNGPLPGKVVDEALQAGVWCAKDFFDRGMVVATLIMLQGRQSVVGRQDDRLVQGVVDR